MRVDSCPANRTATSRSPPFRRYAVIPVPRKLCARLRGQSGLARPALDHPERRGTRHPLVLQLVLPTDHATPEPRPLSILDQLRRLEICVCATIGHPDRIECPPIDRIGTRLTPCTEAPCAFSDRKTQWLQAVLAHEGAGMNGILHRHSRYAQCSSRSSTFAVCPTTDQTVTRRLPDSDTAYRLGTRPLRARRQSTETFLTGAGLRAPTWAQESTIADLACRRRTSTPFGLLGHRFCAHCPTDTSAPTNSEPTSGFRFHC